MPALSTLIGVYPHDLRLPPPSDPLYEAFVSALCQASGYRIATIERLIKQCRDGNTGGASLTDTNMEEDEAKVGAASVAPAVTAAVVGSGSDVGGASSQAGSTQKSLILDDVLPAVCDSTRLMGYLMERCIKPWNDLGAAILRMFPSIPLVELHFDYEENQGYFMRKLAPDDRPVFRVTNHGEPRFFVTEKELNAAGVTGDGAGGASCEGDDSGDDECLVLDRKRYWDFVDNHRSEVDRVFHVAKAFSVRDENPLGDAFVSALVASLMARFCGRGY